jgi:hypothetical protein
VSTGNRRGPDGPLPGTRSLFAADRERGRGSKRSFDKSMRALFVIASLPSPQSAHAEAFGRSPDCDARNRNKGGDMTTIIIIILVILLLGGGGGFYGYNRYGGAGLGGALGLVLIVLLILWLVGAFTTGNVATP